MFWNCAHPDPHMCVCLEGAKVIFQVPAHTQEAYQRDRKSSERIKRIFSAYRSPTSISGPGPQRKDRCHGDHTDGLHGSGVHRHRARTNERFTARALRAARERGGVDMRGLVCVCAFEQHAHLKDVAP